MDNYGLFSDINVDPGFDDRATYLSFDHNGDHLSSGACISIFTRGHEELFDYYTEEFENDCQDGW